MNNYLDIESLSCQSMESRFLKEINERTLMLVAPNEDKQMLFVTTGKKHATTISLNVSNKCMKIQFVSETFFKTNVAFIYILIFLNVLFVLLMLFLLYTICIIVLFLSYQLFLSLIFYLYLYRSICICIGFFLIS